MIMNGINVYGRDKSVVEVDKNEKAPEELKVSGGVSSDGMGDNDDGEDGIVMKDGEIVLAGGGGAVIEDVVRMGEVRVPVVLPQGMKAELREDKQLWRVVSAWGMKMYVPMDEMTMRWQMGVGQKEWGEVDAVFEGEPDGEWKVPSDVLGMWVGKLLKLSAGEALGVYGKLKDGRGGSEWVMVIPKQEVSGVSVDVDDMSKCMATLMKNGYVRVGAIHTHPGESNTPSGTDENDLFMGGGGLHIISGRGGQCRRLVAAQKYWTTIGEETVKLDEDVPWYVATIWSEDGKDAEDEIAKMVTKKVYVQQGTLFQAGRGYDSDEYDFSESGYGESGYGTVYDVALHRWRKKTKREKRQGKGFGFGERQQGEKKVERNGEDVEDIGNRGGLKLMVRVLRREVDETMRADMSAGDKKLEAEWRVFVRGLEAVLGRMIGKIRKLEEEAGELSVQMDDRMQGDGGLGKNKILEYGQREMVCDEMATEMALLVGGLEEMNDILTGVRVSE